jgi:membrane-bound lytic murein transglycosylase F
MTSKITYKTIYLLSILALPIFLGSCRRSGESRFRDVEDLRPERITHLDRIRDRGALRVVTEYNSISYFIYRGQPMGFQYEMLQELANYLDLALEVSVSNDLERNFSDLQEGRTDMIAMNLTVTSERKSVVAFTAPLLQTRQVLVQRKPAQWEKMSRLQIESLLIRNQLDLSGKVVYVQAGSVYENRLRSLSNEIGGGIDIREVNLESEQLIQRVALGEIDYTICDENVGLVNSTYFPQLDVHTAISFHQNVAWAVHPRSDSLRKVIDQWIGTHQKSRNFALLYNKYFHNRHEYRNIHSEYYALGSGKISRFDETIKKESERIGLDWRLMASIIYQESRFNPEAVSWAGAFGLMQLMPSTARTYGISKDSPPEAHIRAGASFIKWLDDRFVDEIEDPQERIKFVLASYNIGLGHIQDARRLAKRYDADPNVWHGSVEEWLLKKSDPAYYTDPVVKYGYARGIETYNFVKQIMSRYEHYKNIMNSDVIAFGRPIQEIRSTSWQ